MSNPRTNAQPRKNVLRAIALAAVVALGSALPLAGPAMAQGFHHDRGWHGGGHGGFAIGVAPVGAPFYPAPVYAPAYPVPTYAPPYYASGYPAPAVGASIALPGIGLFFHVR